MLKEIIINKLIEIYFQPIVSVRTKRIYAFEALTRCTYNEIFIPPNKLFELAKKENLSLELDILARKKSIEKFYSYYIQNKDLILFLNIESSLVNNFDETQDYCCLNTINNLNIPYKNFIIEIKEDEISNTNSLTQFCKYYKNLGFNIALDDFGTGNSTFDRINIIKPYLIKIDKSLFIDIENNLINKEIVKAISKMSYNLGIRVLAEGVEDENAIYNAMESNISLFQGYYFSKPMEYLDNNTICTILSEISEIGSVFQKKTIYKIDNRKNIINKYLKISKKMINLFQNIKLIKNILQEELEKYKEIEAIYLIDGRNSKQIHSSTIKNTTLLFNTYKEGDEHYSKEYFYLTLESRKGIYLSEKYISYFTGNICKTFAIRFKLDKKFYILRLDIITN